MVSARPDVKRGPTRPRPLATARHARRQVGGYNLCSLRSGAPSLPSPRSWRRDLLAPLASALALRLLLIALAPAVPAWDGVIYVRAAEHLARGEGYTLRILDEDYRALPTAFYPVGFPALLALVRMLGGGLFADRLLQTAATSALVPVAYLFARRARGRRAGKMAAWAAALWPGGIFLSSTWLSEPVFAAGLGLALLPLAYARRRRRVRALVFAALGLGAIAYVRATALLIAGLLGGALGWCAARGRPARRTFAALAATLAVTALACVPLAPWALRNARTLGAPVLVSTNGGVNLLLGARGDGSFGSVPADHPCRRPLRELERDRCYTRRALALIASDPGSWLARGLIKLAHTYGHDSAAAQCFGDGLRVSAPAQASWLLWALGLSRVGWLVLFAAALAGACSVARQASPTMRAILFAPLGAIALLHTVYLGGDRYHAAVAPMLLALAGIYAAERARSRVRQDDTLEVEARARPRATASSRAFAPETDARAIAREADAHEPDRA